MQEKYETQIDKIPPEVLEIIWDKLNRKTLTSLARVSSFFNSPKSRVNEVIKAKYGIRQIALGEYNTLILRNNGRLFGCGSNYCGMLGLGLDVENQMSLAQIIINGLREGEVIEKIALGYCYTLLLTNQGRLFDAGAINFIHNLYSLQRTRQYIFAEITIEGLPNNELPKAIGVGRTHAMVLTSAGSLFVRGSGTRENNEHYFGQLGLGAIESQDTFVRLQIAGLEDGEIPVKIHVGMDNNLILTSRGNLYGCGQNCYGQLGLGRQDTFALIPMEGLRAGETIVSFYATPTNSFILTSLGGFLGCGHNSFGQLGSDEINSCQSKFKPITIAGLKKEERPTKIAVGNTCVYVLTSEKRLFGCAATPYRFGIDHAVVSQNSYIEITLQGLKKDEVIEDIYLGITSNHIMVVTSSGKQLVCGQNWFGQLGRKDIKDQSSTFILCPPLPEPEDDQEVLSGCGL